MALYMQAVRVIEINPDSGEFAVRVTKGGEPIQGVTASRISKIEERVMTWLGGAPQIHLWIQRNLLTEEASAGSVGLTQSNLQQLLERCETVLARSVLAEFNESDDDDEDDDRPEDGTLIIQDTAAALAYLPLPAPGQYGETRRYYDKDYLRQLEETRDFLERITSDLAYRVPGEIIYRYEIY